MSIRFTKPVIGWSKYVIGAAIKYTDHPGRRSFSRLRRFVCSRSNCLNRQATQATGRMAHNFIQSAAQVEGSSNLAADVYNREKHFKPFSSSLFQCVTGSGNKAHFPLCLTVLGTSKSTHKALYFPIFIRIEV